MVARGACPRVGPTPGEHSPREGWFETSFGRYQLLSSRNCHMAAGISFLRHPAGNCPAGTGREKGEWAWHGGAGGRDSCGST
jgi:hypothetical protein